MVYEDITNGTLFQNLHGLHPGISLPWHGRLCIAQQTAEGLAYPHSCITPQIFHRDVTSSNMLLDENLNEKVSGISPENNSSNTVDFSRDEGDENLVISFKKVVDEERMMEIIDPPIKDGANKREIESISSFAFHALRSLKEVRQKRPSMGEVVDQIQHTATESSTRDDEVDPDVACFDFEW